MKSLLICLFLLVGSNTMAMTYEEAVLEAKTHLYQANKLSPEALRALEQYTKPDGQEGVLVYLYNRRGQLHLSKVNEKEWNQTRGNCPSGQRHPYRFGLPQTLENNRCVRRVVLLSHSPDKKNWATNPETKQLEVQFCNNETLESCRFVTKDSSPPTCEYESLLDGTGLTFDDIKKSGAIDCQTKTVKENPFLANACNLYWEAKGEGTKGKIVVREIFMNRVRSNQDRRDYKDAAGNVWYAKTIQGAVYEKRLYAGREDAQASWTLQGDQVVRFNNNPTTMGDRSAWFDSLYLAADQIKHHTDGQGRPSGASGSPLGCYTHYLSLHKFDRKDRLTHWARAYTDESKGKDANYKPICVGGHILYRDTRDEYPCTQPPEIVRNASSLDLEEAEKGRFLKYCLGEENFGNIDEPDSPHSSLCDDNNWEQLVCAQLRENPGIAPNGRNYICDKNNGYDFTEDSTN